MEVVKIAESAKSNFELQFHLLGHFISVPDKYRNILTSKLDLGNKDIDKQLAVSGSKFSVDFVKDPLNLMDRVIYGLTHLSRREIFHNSIPDIAITFDTVNYPKGIGLDGIISMDEIDPQLIPSIEVKHRAFFDIKVIKGKMSPSWQLNIIFGKNKSGKMDIHTIFPGIYAPPFPDADRQAENIYKAAKNFWDKHVFVI